MKISSSVLAGCCALSLLIFANTAAPALGQDVALDIDAMESGVRSAFVDNLKECGTAVLDLATMLRDDNACPMAFESVFSYLSTFEAPRVDFSWGSGIPIPNLKNLPFDGKPKESALPSIAIDFGIPNTLPDVTDLCKDDGCMSKLRSGLAAVDEKCAADDLKLLPGNAAHAIKAVRAFVEGICATDDNGNFCLQAIADILVNEAGKLFDDDASKNRDILCSECSINAQKSLLSVLGVPETFHSLLQLTCLKDRSDGSYCPGADVMRGVAYAAQPKLYISFFGKNGLCKSCMTQAVALSTPFLSGEHQEECYTPSGEASSGDDTKSVRFTFFAMDFDEVNVKDVITALKKDLAVAFHTVEEYVNVIFDSPMSLRRLGQPGFEASVTFKTDEHGLTVEDMVVATKNSPFSNTNNVTDVTINPTKYLEVSMRFVSDEASSSDSDETSSSSFASLRVVPPLAMIASTLFFSAA